MRKNGIIDYTKCKLSKYIIKCPRCGKHGLLVNFTDGSHTVKHRIDCNRIIPLITESCFFKKGTFPNKKGGK